MQQYIGKAVLQFEMNTNIALKRILSKGRSKIYVIYQNPDGVESVAQLEKNSAWKYSAFK